MDTNIIKNGIPFTGKLVITVNDGEIPVSPGDFWRMNKENMFTNVSVDGRDCLKLVGVSKDGEVFVSVKVDEEMTETELQEYCKRESVLTEFNDSGDDTFYENDTYLSANEGVVNG